jgi:predicted Zn-dependent protease
VKCVVFFKNTFFFKFSLKFDQCREFLALLEKEFPKDERLAVLTAALYFREKKFTKCEETLSTYVKNSDATQSVRAQLSLAQLKLNDRNFKAASSVLESLIKAFGSE